MKNRGNWIVRKGKEFYFGNKQTLLEVPTESTFIGVILSMLLSRAEIRGRLQFKLVNWVNTLPKSGDLLRLYHR